MASKRKEILPTALSTTYDMGNGEKESILYHPWIVPRDVDIKATEKITNANRAVQQQFWQLSGKLLSQERRQLIEQVNRKQAEFALKK